MYGIYPMPWGFTVSVTRDRARHVEIFGVAQWGGREEALRQARAWRDSLIQRVLPATRRERAEKLRVNNKTGVSGVTPLLRADGSVQGWRAKTYVGPGQILHVYFPMSVHGEAAKELAIEARAAQLEQMAGLTRPHPAEASLRTRPASRRAPAGRKLSKPEIVGRNNSSGVSGVQFKAGQGEHPGYWMAITGARGAPSISKAFSIKTHGFETAKELAIAERARQLTEKNAGPPDSHP
ncbi:AP2 domain-containing protein [Variovorax sp. H27-G14]|uniref:AP2 domain-containing protein n=1 Tax=Variovorax sp. H27-G14 TaxID=3111914 RepID=UPI0038FD15C4